MNSMPVPPSSGSPTHDPYMYPGPGRPEPGNPPGTIAAGLAGLLLAWGLVATVIQARLIASPDPYTVYGAFALANVVITGVIGLAAVVLGAVGLNAKGRPHGLAGIGLGVGALALFDVLVNGLLFSTLVDAFH